MKRFLALFAISMLVFAPSAMATPGDPYAPQYYFDDWQVPKIWAGGARGQGITIAEIDTGVDAAIGVFDGRVVPGKDFGRLGGNGETDRDIDSYGHGTSMASIMVGRPGQFGIEGLAPGAKVMPVAIPLDGTTDAASDDRLPQAIEWAADHGAKIISMSLGGVRRSALNSTACPADEQMAIFHALNKGALVIASGGNRGQKGNAVEEPGVCLGVVSVGAVDRNGTVASFSSRHPYLTVSAPGVDIASIGPGGTPFAGDGTSQAAAITSAAAAVVWSKFPQMSADQVLGRLLATLDHRRSTRNAAYGYGTINPYRAVTTSVPKTAADPVYSLAKPFLQRAAAQASTPAPVAPIVRTAAPPGRYSVGAAPGVLVPRVIVGITVAAAGLVLLIVLVLVGMAGRRRRIRQRVVLVPAYPAPALTGRPDRDDQPRPDWQDAWAPEPGRPRPGPDQR